MHSVFMLSKAFSKSIKGRWNEDLKSAHNPWLIRRMLLLPAQEDSERKPTYTFSFKLLRFFLISFMIILARFPREQEFMGSTFSSNRHNNKNYSSPLLSICFEVSAVSQIFRPWLILQIQLDLREEHFWWRTNDRQYSLGRCSIYLSFDQKRSSFTGERQPVHISGSHWI